MFGVKRSLAKEVHKGFVRPSRGAWVREILQGN